MGLASSVAFMPTSSTSGGSFAPIENSPPGIQTIPTGAGPGAAAGVGTVGAKVLAVLALGAGAAEDAASDAGREHDETRDSMSEMATCAGNHGRFAADGESG